MKNTKLKKTNLVYAICIAFTSLLQAQNYTWMKGSNMADQPGLYGTLGVPASTNNPGSRSGACQWKDASGNFWLFGGSGYDAAGNSDVLNDLWKYTVSTNEWTWIAGDSVIAQDGVYGTIGVPASTNKPGSRAGAVSWRDASGNLWLFGGYGYDAFSTMDILNDLWKYNIITNQWTWMKGSNISYQYASFGTQGVAASTNVPGSSFLGTAWTDVSGDLWLFGGEGNDLSNYGDLHDLWKYSVSNNQWTWMKGTGLVNQNGVYGTILTPATTNLPGSRFIASGWADASGNFWLMGGLGYDATSFFGSFLNDLWKYSITTNEWTWVKGSNSSDQSGTYGTLGVSASGNVPGARLGHASWTNSITGDLYLFGGSGYDSGTNPDDLNDLWKYSPTLNEWTWIKGSNTAAQNGIYGTQGTAGIANTPGSRSLGSTWVDNSNNLWLFGGSGIDAFSYGELNDLWKLAECVAPSLTVAALQPTICPGGSTTLTVSGANTYSWNTTQTTNTITVSPVNTTTYNVTGTFTNTGCSSSLSFTQEVYPVTTITISSNRGANVCKGESGNYTATGANTYTWSNGNTGASSTVSFSNTGTITYTCTYTDANSCVNTSTLSKTVNECTGINENNNSLTVSSLFPNPSNGQFNIVTSNYENAKLNVFNSIGQKVIDQTLTTEKTEIQSTLQKGVYIYQIIQNNTRIGNGKLIIE